MTQYKKNRQECAIHTHLKTDNSDLRNKYLDDQFSIVFTKNLIKLQESLNNNLKRCSRGRLNGVEGQSKQSQNIKQLFFRGSKT